MKTRICSLHLIIYIGIILFSTSCENEIPYTPAHSEPQLIMNALLDAGEAENYVYLNLSGTHGLSHVEEATVNLYVNGKLVEKAEELPHSNLLAVWIWYMIPMHLSITSRK